jgi:hypothetical protein
MAGDIAATAGTNNALGIYSDGSISIGSIAETGSVTATAGTSYAYGLRVTGAVTIAGEMAGDIAAMATSGSNAYGIYSLNALSIGSIAETGSITATPGTNNAYGLRAFGDATIADHRPNHHGHGYERFRSLGIYSQSAALSIGSITETGSITAQAGTSDAYGLRGATGVTMTGQWPGTSRPRSREAQKPTGYILRAARSASAPSQAPAPSRATAETITLWPVCVSNVGITG